MLHATAHHGKSTLYKRYLGHRDGIEKSVHEEDEITSTVIGPLDFLLPEEVHRFWHTVLEHKILPSDSPSSTCIKFWPKNNKIEPDARVDFHWSNNDRCILLIELKWHAPLSGNDQLHQQWKQYLQADERKNALHVFIAPEISQGINAQQDKKTWGDRLVIVTWMQIRNALKSLEGENSGLGRWAKVANSFLERIGVRQFIGFRRLDLKEIPNLENVSKPIFWKPFVGFSKLMPLPELPTNITSTLFFGKTQ